jgi:hypothetical protein
MRSLLKLLFAVIAAITKSPPLPRLIQHNLHPFMKRCYGKVVAGGGRTPRLGLAIARLAVVLLILTAVTATAVVAQTGPPDMGFVLAYTFVGTTLVEKRQEFAAKQRELAEVMELAKDGRVYNLSRKSVLEKLGAVDDADALSKVKARNVELD